MNQRQLLDPLVWVVAFSLSSGASADDAAQRGVDWRQWRGPEATGLAPHGDPPTRWDERTNIKWKSPIPGRGASTPIICGDRIFILTAIDAGRRADDAEPAAHSGQSSSIVPAVLAEAGDRDPDDAPRDSGDRRSARSGGKKSLPNYHQFVVLCLDRNTGQTLWRQIACEVAPHQGHHSTSSFASASPVTDGRYVYCSFGSRGVYCYDLDGKRQWRADLGQMQIKFGFGEGSSPALYRRTLIVNCDQEEGSFITALDAATGQPKWKTPRDENSTWNTPLVAEYAGRTQVIVNGAKAARSYDLASGELIWEYPGEKGVDAIPSPMRLGDLAICTSGLRRDPAYAIPLSASGRLTDADRAWKHAKGTPQIASAALVGERLYFVKGRSGIMSCINARTGEVIIDQNRLPGIDDVYASPVVAAGRVYFTARDGATVVVDATADQLRVLAENKLDETIMGSPAIAGNEMFIRGEQHLYCIAN